MPAETYGRLLSDRERGKWVQQTALTVPEMEEVKPLLEQSARGIEFTGRTARAAAASIEAMRWSA